MSNASFFKLTLIITPESSNSDPEHNGNSLMSNGHICIYGGWEHGAEIVFSTTVETAGEVLGC